MAVVRVLPHIVADMIAAGEVVDRPASVVKELVENSLDAGASSIAVRIEGAGREAVVVEDDGVGMEPEDALLSFRRHATSKIASEEDLSRITTLGFRGEALASIASVSRMALVTRRRDADSATRVESEGGRLTGPAPSGGAPGTYVEVRDLFFNTPARRKFLKSDATEVKNVVDTMTRLALVHPSVGFTLESGGRRILSLPQGQSPEERTADALGLDSLSWFRDEGAGLVFAFSPPHEGKGRRDGVKLFVNRRAVNDRTLFAAVMEGYRGLIAEGRYPAALLWLDLDPASVDVNVHPAKREVRFSDERAIFALVSSRVSRALSAAARGGGDVPTPDPWGSFRHESPGVERVAEALSTYGRSVAGRAEPFPTGRGYPQRQGRPLSFSGYGRERPPSPDSTALETRTERAAGFFSQLAYLGAFDATYLIFEDRESRELVLVDQHAAHERILYESLREGAALPGASQQLLVPVVVECEPGAMELLEERAPELALIGIRAEPFGSRAVSVTAAPAGLDAGAISAIVLDFLASRTPEEADLSRTLADRAAARAACAGAVKARRELLPSEVAELMARLGNLENPTHCPHGRPLIARLGREKVAALFLRR